MPIKKVAILMSTYNGEKYIEQQLESLFNKTYKNIEIYIRDDGSKDNTVKILEKYEEQGKIKLIQGKNIGFIKSFRELLNICDDADYYAYCDQDDVWFEDKIERAVNKLNNIEDNNIPILYASNYDYYYGDINFIMHTGFENKKPSFAKSLVECIAPGMTMVINKTAKNTIFKNMPENCLLHDWWTYEVCIGIGKVIYDGNITVKYRRHSNNVTTVETTFIKRFVWRVKTFIFSDHWKNLKKQLISFEDIFFDKLNKKDQKILKLFTKKITFITQIQKLFYPIRFKDTISNEIMIRCMFIMGRI